MINLLDQLESLVLGLVIILIARHIIESFLKFFMSKIKEENLKGKSIHEIVDLIEND